MKTNTARLLAALLLCSALPGESSGELGGHPALKYQRRYNILPQRLLDLDAEATVVPDQAYALLDEIVAEAKARISTSQVTAAKKGDERAAIGILTTIDDVLITHNFVYQPDKKQWPRTMVKSLTAHQLSPAQFDHFMASASNARRISRLRRDDPVYYVVCDTGSLIYMGIGEALGLDLRPVNVPEHTFIRWYYQDGSSFNWDTNFGMKTSDELYSANIPEWQIKSGFYMRSLTPQEVLGYYYGSRAYLFKDKHDYERAAQDFWRSIELYPDTDLARNNLAWLYATSPTPVTGEQKSAALALALRAASDRFDANHLDTLACAFAINGDFKKAIAFSQEAVERDRSDEDFVRDLKALSIGQRCAEASTGASR